MIRHIPLTDRKALSGRLLYLDAINQFGIALSDETSGLSNIKEFFFAFLNAQVDLDRQQRNAEIKQSKSHLPLKPLDISLQEAVRQFRSAPIQAQINRRARVGRFLDAITTSAESLSCEQCTGSKVVCEGVAQTKDDAFVAQQGDCIKQLRQIFEVARDAAQVYYAKYSEDFPSDPSPGILLSTEKTSKIAESQHALPKFYAGAVTTFHDEASQATAETKLCVIIDEIDPRTGKLITIDLYTYKGLVYLMFHECISHAFHGVVPKFGERKPTRPFDSFAEGFMDFVAYLVLKETMEDVGVAGELQLRKRIAFADSLTVAQKIYADRNICEENEFLTNKANIERGVRAAETVLSLVEKAYKSEEFGPSGDYKRGFFRLAFDLNLRRDVSLGERAAFVALMSDYAFLSSLDRKQLDRTDIFRLLDTEAVLNDYLRTQSITNLISDALELKGRD